MIEFDNLTSIKVKPDFIKSIVKKILKKEDRPDSKVYISLVEPEEIRQLKKEYLGIDKTTDVLSFREPPFSKKNLELSKKTLGEIIVCPKVVKKNSKKFESSFKEELTKVLIHGVLHLLGYKHNKAKDNKMKQKEELYLKSFY